MDESAARNVLAVRAIELEDRERALWSDADRAWASEAAARDLGEGATADAFVSTRAARALERLTTAAPALRRTLAAFTWRGWIAPIALLTAFALGMAADQIGGRAGINILAPPVIGVLAWNLAVYLILLLRPIVRNGTARFVGPLRNVLLVLGAGRVQWPRRRGSAPLGAALASFAADWSRFAAPVYVARAARLLHGAAALFAVGVIVGLYVRGIALEYRASWESTFLDAHDVRRVLDFVLAPGAWLTGLAVPGVDAIASIRAPASENAARWLHLFAATLGAVVIIPRLALAAVNGLLEERRARHMPVDVDEPYFRRLLRGYRDAPITVRVVPYSYTIAPERESALRTILVRALAANAAIALEPSTAYGSDHVPASDAGAPAADVTIALFNAAATPEREAHGAFVAAIAQERRAPPLALVDETSLRERWGPDPAQRDARRHAWREVLAGARVMFIDLGAPDVDSVETALVQALDAAH